MFPDNHTSRSRARWSILLAAALLGVVAVASPAIAIPITDGLISYWSGDVSGVNVIDQAGSNNGTLIGDATVSAGIEGQAFSFDGDGDYIKMPDASSLDFGTTDFTISLLSKLDGPIVDMTGLIHKGDYHTSNGWWIYFSGVEGRILFGRQAWSVQIEAYYPDDQGWHHVTVERESGTFRIFVDGVMGTTQTGAFNLTSTHDLIIGAYANYGRDADWPIDGLIDEVAIYNRALTESEIQQLGAIPEPATMLLLGSGLIALAGFRRKFRKEY